MTLSFTDEGWAGYLSWTGDARALKRIHRLIADIQRNGKRGIGKPEPLTGDWSGWWSRRIDDQHRLVYRETASGVEIAQCRGHYGDH
ncbi:MAG: Txe/YoeB family addiction module toxin [Bifidobacteriaceae bacterium]|nr:Txe/YoeB family addiction module toxin [Bifidobacteriaceae bacterium]